MQDFQLDLNNLFEIIFQAFLFFCVYFIFYKKNIYSIFDPLFLYIFTLAFSSVLVFNTLGETQPIYAYHFFLCHLFFFIGFILIVGKPRIDKQKSLLPYSIRSFSDYTIFRIVLYILCAVYFVANVVLFYTTGFALLSDDPSIAKVEYVATGFGFISNINTGVGGFVLTGLFFCLFTKLRYIDLLLLLITIVLSSLTGSKSAFMAVVAIFVLIANHPLFNRNHKIAVIIKLIAPFCIVCVLSLFFIVLSKETADSEQAILKFMLRLLYGADSTLYFYLPVNEQYFSQFHFWQYPAFLFNQILAFLRLVPYVESHGNTMVLNVIQNQSIIFSGPNTPYYIEGQIYFGYYGAFIYSAIIGAIFAYSRNFFFNKQFRSAFSFVLIGCITYRASLIVIEVTYGFTNIFDTLFFVIPVYLVVNFTISGKVRLGKFDFNKPVLINKQILKHH